MDKVLLKLIENPRASIVTLIIFMMTYCVPCYMAVKVSNAVDRLTEKIECGQKFYISAIESQTQYD
ncbi:MAG: hypothetical protein AAGI66_09815 [Cyanobacteria bacterium P01_H01_bin.74]